GAGTWSTGGAGASSGMTDPRAGGPITPRAAPRAGGTLRAPTTSPHRTPRRAWERGRAAAILPPSTRRTRRAPRPFPDVVHDPLPHRAAAGRRRGRPPPVVARYRTPDRRRGRPEEGPPEGPAG